MENIIQLCSLNYEKMSVTDSYPLWSYSTQSNRRVTAQDLINFINANSPTPTSLGWLTQYSSPAATGFSINVTGESSSVAVNNRLIIRPVGAYALGTIVLPDSSVLVNRQEILVTCSQQVDVFVVDGNGLVVNGGPGVLAADSFFTLMYDSVIGAWYRVG